METITITHRRINGKDIYNKRFDDYETGFYGAQISKKEYEEARNNPPAWEPDTAGNQSLGIIERYTVTNRMPPAPMINIDTSVIVNRFIFCNIVKFVKFVQVNRFCFHCFGVYRVRG